MTRVTAPVLLRGAWYALAQCGRLLEHADILYQAEAYSSSVALALLSREELGRYRIHLDYWRRAHSGGLLPAVEEIRNATEHHVEKQRRGMALIRVVRSQIAAIGLASKFRREARRAPQDRHEMRMRATYVELNWTGTDWLRPSQIGRDMAVVVLEDAISDYMNVRLRLENAGPDADALLAFQAWPDRPTLRPPPLGRRQQTATRALPEG